MENWRVETYRLQANLPAYTRNIERSLRVIEEALKEESASYVSWSGGKDSTVLLDLVRKINPNIPIVHVRTDIEYPDCKEWVDKFIQEQGLNVTILEPPSAWQVLIEEGGPFGQVNVATSRIDKECFFDPIAKENEAKHYKQVFLGLRAEESNARRMNALSRGTRYYNKSRKLWTTLPLAWWTARDIFAYHVVNDLPWEPIYDRTYLHPDPERIREGWWTTGQTAHRHGMGDWLRYHYPQLWRRAVENWPEFGGN
jgi:phosphoadenosine phosphosulfate reductase